MSFPEARPPREDSPLSAAVKRETKAMVRFWIYVVVPVLMLGLFAFSFFRGCVLVDRVNDIDDRLHRIERYFDPKP